MFGIKTSMVARSGGKGKAESEEVIGRGSEDYVTNGRRERESRSNLSLREVGVCLMHS